MKNGTRKWVVKVMSSHLVFFLNKMGHCFVQWAEFCVQCSDRGVQQAVWHCVVCSVNYAVATV